MANILIVDDEQAFAEIGQLILERAGFAVGIAPSAVEAMKMIEAFPPDLVLCDVEMPQMDGFEFLRLLRSNPRFHELPFIFMSARRTYPTDRVHGLDLGSDDYISKPFSGDELISRVKAILRRIGKAGGAVRKRKRMIGRTALTRRTFFGKFCMGGSRGQCSLADG